MGRPRTTNFLAEGEGPFGNPGFQGLFARLAEYMA